ncbi:MAG TPA: hypothetical protein VGP53_01240 [Acidimicrobiales bacterium]|nr:hypothetical protein [Acidimicrobiales bacterium]
MDDDVPRSAEPLPDSVADDADDLRRMIDAGAGTSTELRALAARLREHRSMEEERWRTEVKPALLKSKKAKLSFGDLRDRPDGHGSLGTGLALLGGVLVLLLAATQVSFLWIFLPATGVLACAWWQGRRMVGPTGDDPPG